MRFDYHRFILHDLLCLIDETFHVLSKCYPKINIPRHRLIGSPRLTSLGNSSASGTTLLRQSYIMKFFLIMHLGRTSWIPYWIWTIHLWKFFLNTFMNTLTICKFSKIFSNMYTIFSPIITHMNIHLYSTWVYDDDVFREEKNSNSFVYTYLYAYTWRDLPNRIK